MDSQVQFNSEKTGVKKVFYEGTDQMRGGYALCYNADTNLVQKGTTVAATAVNIERVVRVEKPAVGNVRNFAGLVSENDDSKTGPCWLTIVQPSANGVGVLAWTSAACTIGVTPLYLQAGSYALGVSGVRLVAEALQTVDRSTTNGTALVMLRTPFNGASVSARARTTVQLPTAAIWDNFPLDAMRVNPFLGSLMESDFTRPIGAMSTGQTAINSGDIFGDGATELIATAPATTGIGTLVLSAGTANKEIAWRPGAPVILSGSGKWAFEARVAFGTITDGDYAGAFIGWLNGDYLMAGDELVDTSGVLIDKDLIGFNILAGDGNAVLRSYRAVGQAVQASATVLVPVAAAYDTLGLYYNGTTVVCYINGAVVAAGAASAANIAAATFPSAKSAVPFIGFKELAAEVNTLTVDWARFAYLPS